MRPITSGLELLGPVAREAGPGICARNEVAQALQHLASVAHTEGERAVAVEEFRELVAAARIETDRMRPPASGSEYVAEGESAAGGETG